MNGKLVAIHLHGPLADRYGTPHRLCVQSPREAIHALDANFPGFIAMFAEHEQYGIYVDDEWREGEAAAIMPASKDIHFVPVIEGNVPVVALGLTAAFGIGATAATIIGSLLVTGLMLGLAMLFRPKKPEKEQQEKSESFIFTGPENVTGQGVAVPLIYGRVFAGSVVVSAGQDTVDMIVTTPAVGSPRPATPSTNVQLHPSTGNPVNPPRQISSHGRAALFRQSSIGRLTPLRPALRDDPEPYPDPWPDLANEGAGTDHLREIRPDATTLNPLDKKSSLIVLSNGNLTISGFDAGGNNWARSTTSKLGRRYVEFITTTVANTIIGISDLSPMVFPGANAHSFGLFANGAGSIAGTFPYWGVPYASGDVVGMAVDFTAKLVWFRTNGGHWNGDPAADPEAGKGGMPINAYNGTPHYVIVSGDSGHVATVNFGATAFAAPRPFSFISWELMPTQGWPNIVEDPVYGFKPELWVPAKTIWAVEENDLSRKQVMVWQPDYETEEFVYNWNMVRGFYVTSTALEAEQAEWIAGHEVEIPIQDPSP